MPVMEIGDEQVDVLPHAVEATVRLGWVRLDAAAWLADQVVQHADRTGGRSIREAGTRLGKDELAGLGLPRWPGGHLSREVWAALTEAGRAAPVERFDLTCRRVERAAREEARRQGALPLLRSGLFAAVRIVEQRGLAPCAAGSALLGQVLPVPPVLPVEGCDKPVCDCAWRLVRRTEL